MINTTNMMIDSLKSYANPVTKLSRLTAQGECVQISKGLYETDSTTPGFLLSGSIYGPSYISFEYALSLYGLIPEAAYVITCATFEKKKKKKYETPFGTFTYRDVPSAAFPHYLSLVQEGEYFYRIAQREKALCDKLYTLEPVPNIKELSKLLFDDLRIDIDEFLKLDQEKIDLLCTKYHSTNIKKVSTLLRRIRNERNY